MPTFTYVTVSYCYVGVSYPVVSYADEGYCLVSYPVVGYGFVGVTYRYVSESYRGVGYGGVRYGVVGYGGVWRLEMWRRTHPQSLTRGPGTGRIVGVKGKRERKEPLMTKIEALRWTAEWDLATAVAKTQWFAQCSWDEARDALLAVAGRGALGRYSAADVSCAWARIRPSTAPAD